MSRRGINIYKRKDGRWEGRFKKESSKVEKREYISVYGKTYGEVKEKMNHIRNSFEEQQKQGAYTLKEALDIWMREKKPYWKPTTYMAYVRMADKYIFPCIEKVFVERVDNEFMEKFLSVIRKNQKGSRLSEGYLRNICAVIIRALNHMKKKHRCKIELPENPVQVIRRGQVILPREWELATLETYLMQNWEDDTCLGILTAFYTGMRIGELCALTWGDIDLEGEVICIRKNLQRIMEDDGQKNKTKILMQKPKSHTSTRLIPIPPVLLPLLKSQKKENSSFLIKGKKKEWAEPRTLQYRFAGILKKCGLEQFNFHMLRHAFATRCITSGFDVKSVSEILGHSSVQTTLNLYVHSSMQHKRKLMKNLSGYLNGDQLLAV